MTSKPLLAVLPGGKLVVSPVESEWGSWSIEASPCSAGLIEGGIDEFLMGMWLFDGTVVEFVVLVCIGVFVRFWGCPP